MYIKKELFKKTKELNDKTAQIEASNASLDELFNNNYEYRRLVLDQWSLESQI